MMKRSTATSKTATTTQAMTAATMIMIAVCIYHGTREAVTQLIIQKCVIRMRADPGLRVEPIVGRLILAGKVCLILPQHPTAIRVGVLELSKATKQFRPRCRATQQATEPEHEMLINSSLCMPVYLQLEIFQAAMSLLEQLGSISRHDERPRPAALASADVKIQQRPKVTQEELSLALLAVFADPGLQGTGGEQQYQDEMLRQQV